MPARGARLRFRAESTNADVFEEAGGCLVTTHSALRFLARWETVASPDCLLYRTNEGNYRARQANLSSARVLENLGGQRRAANVPLTEQSMGGNICPNGR